MKFKVVLEKESENGYSVHVPALKGCHTQGETVEEALKNVKEAIQLYLDYINREASKSEIVYDVEIAA